MLLGPFTTVPCGTPSGHVCVGESRTAINWGKSDVDAVGLLFRGTGRSFLRCLIGETGKKGEFLGHTIWGRRWF